MIVFMGPVGAGKSVQGHLLKDHLGFEYLSTGEYLRAHLSPEREKEMLAGKLLADEELIEILMKFFDGIEDQSKVILDGFPRTLPQAKWLLEVHKTNQVKISCVIYLNATKDVIRERLLSRGRDDDRPEVIDRRFEAYEEMTLPIIDWFKNNGIKVYEINADRSVEEIQQDIRNSLNLGI